MQLTNAILVGLALLVGACSAVPPAAGGAKAPAGAHQEVRLERLERRG